MYIHTHRAVWLRVCVPDATRHTRAHIYMRERSRDFASSTAPSFSLVFSLSSSRLHRSGFSVLFSPFLFSYLFAVRRDIGRAHVRGERSAVSTKLDVRTEV